MAGKIKVTIDREDCTSCAACWGDCPEFFEESPDDGYSQVVEQYRTEGDPGEGEAPQELKDCVQTAAEDCPVEIIHVGA